MAQDKQTLQYGLWPSPIGPQGLAEGLRLSDVAWDSDGETLVWAGLCWPAEPESFEDCQVAWVTFFL